MPVSEPTDPSDTCDAAALDLQVTHELRYRALVTLLIKKGVFTREDLDLAISNIATTQRDQVLESFKVEHGDEPSR
jgi:hypothetical protein